MKFISVLMFAFFGSIASTSVYARLDAICYEGPLGPHSNTAINRYTWDLSDKLFTDGIFIVANGHDINMPTRKFDKVGVIDFASYSEYEVTYLVTSSYVPVTIEYTSGGKIFVYTFVYEVGFIPVPLGTPDSMDGCFDIVTIT
ncbi:hypothetical protein [Bowmanella denitrificans]|uniref:hypothetical protein n=1 Tax=Bowmanella denitrificans TaxID=366582 RepID=UPI000C9A39DB|nr:hypothetical protein [Bowmanella denitrificans]